MPPHSPIPASARPRWPGAPVLKVSVIGSGRLGPRAAASFAGIGHDVLCAKLGDGDQAAAARHGELVFVALGTSLGTSFGMGNAGGGRAGALTNLFAAAVEVAQNLRGPAIVVDDGTVSATTASHVAQLMAEHTSQEIIVVSTRSFDGRKLA